MEQIKKTLYVYIGTVANKWSHKTKSDHKLRIGTQEDKKADIIFNGFITKQRPEFLDYRLTKIKLKNDSAYYLDLITFKYKKQFNQIKKVADNYSKISLMVAPGGLFGSSVTPILIELLSDNQIELSFSSFNNDLGKEDEALLLNLIVKYKKLDTKKIYLQNMDKLKDLKMSEFLDLLDKKVEKHITNHNH